MAVPQMIQLEFAQEGDEVTDSLVRLPRTSRHFIATGTHLENHTETCMICSCCGEVSTVFLECGDRTCFQCQQRRKKRILKRYHPIVAKMTAPKFLTVTLTRRILSRHAVKHMRDCFTKLRHRGIWTAVGGIYQIQLGTIDNGTVNIHLHAIIDSPRVEKADLRKAWYKITGDSYIVDIKTCWSPRGAMQYLTKHMGRRIGTYQDASLINEVLHGTRLVQGFGSLSHMGLSMTDSVCDNCGGVNTYYLDFEVLTYQYPRKICAF